MAESVKLSGFFRIYDSSGPIDSESRDLTESTDIVEKTAYKYAIEGSQTNVPLPMVGLSTAKKVLINPSAACTLKINSSGETGFTIDSLTILGGSITGLWVTTSAAVTLDVVMGGSA